MPSRPPRPIMQPGDLLVGATGGGPGYLVERVIDPRPDSWRTRAVGFAKTEAEAIALARKARAESAIWVQSNPHQRRARRVRDDQS